MSCSVDKYTYIHTLVSALISVRTSYNNKQNITIFCVYTFTIHLNPIYHLHILIIFWLFLYIFFLFSHSLLQQKAVMVVVVQIKGNGCAE